MKKIFLSLVPSVLCSMACTATDVSGDITTNTTWTKANSPYIMVGSVNVASGVKLTIEPGTVIRSSGVFTLHINGSLNATGTIADSIYFGYDKNNSLVNRWGGILIDGSATDSSIFKFCYFEDVDKGIQSRSSNVFVSNSVFNKCNQGMNVTYTNSDIRNCLFTNAGYGIFCNQGYTNISDNVFHDNGWGINASTGRITGNLIYNNRYGINNGDSVYGNVIAYNENGVTGYIVNFLRNQVWNNKIGMEYSYMPGIVEHNGFNYNDVGVICRTTSTANFRYNCIENSTSYAFKNGTSNVDMSGNYWGETDSVKIGLKIFDYNDNNNVATGVVSILPVLQSADSGCADSVNIPGYGNPTSVVNVNKTADLKVYPNPVSGSVTIQAPGDDKMNTVIVYNLVGTEVFKTNVNGNRIVIDMSSYANGMYLYKVQMNDNSSITGKLLKE